MEAAVRAFGCYLPPSVGWPVGSGFAGAVAVSVGSGSAVLVCGGVAVGFGFAPPAGVFVADGPTVRGATAPWVAAPGTAGAATSAGAVAGVFPERVAVAVKVAAARPLTVTVVSPVQLSPPQAAPRAARG